jgi:hypothetical protein
MFLFTLLKSQNQLNHSNVTNIFAIFKPKCLLFNLGNSEHFCIVHFFILHNFLLERYREQDTVLALQWKSLYGNLLWRFHFEKADLKIAITIKITLSVITLSTFQNLWHYNFEPNILVN